MYLKQDKLEEAEKATKKVLRLDSGSANDLLDAIKRAYCTRGQADLRLDRLTSAKAAVDEALRLDSNYKPAHALLERIKNAYYDQGIVSLGQGENKEAIANFKSVLMIDGRFIKAYCGITNAHLKSGELASAEETVKDILRLDSSDKSANELLEKIKMGYCNRGDSFLRRGWYKAAISTFEKALEIDPGFMKAHCGIASVHLDQRALAHAAEIVRKVLCLDSEYEPANELLKNTRNAYYDRAYECLKQDKFTDAEKAAVEALRLDSSYEPARELLEEVKHIYQAQGDIFLKRDEEAESYFQKANAISIDFTETGFIKACCRLGYFYLVQNELDLAKAAVDEALGLDSENESAHELLKKIKYRYCDRGFKFLDKNRYDEAIIYFRNLLSMDTNFTEAYRGIALAYLGQGKLTALKKVVDGVLWNDLGYESDHEFLEEIKLIDYARGINLLNQNQYDEAITCFENLLSMDTNFMEAHCSIALAYLGQGELEAAEQVISEVLWSKSNYEYDSASAILEDIKQTYYNRAITFLNEYQYSEAVPDFEDTIAIDVNFTEAYLGLWEAYLGFGSVYFGQLHLTEEDAGETDAMWGVPEYDHLLAIATQVSMQEAYLTGETGFSQNTDGWSNQDFFRSSLPSDVVRKIKEFDTVYATLCQELLREPLRCEIAEALGLTEREVEEILVLNANVLSTDLPLNIECSTETLGDLIEDPTTNGEDGPT